MKRNILVFTLLVLLVQLTLMLGKNNIDYINSPKLLPSIKSNSEYTIIPTGNFLVPVDYNGNPLDYYYENGLLYVKNNRQPFKLIGRKYTMSNSLFYNILNIPQISSNEQWLPNWKYRTPITIQEQSGQDLKDYQVKITLDSSWDG